jgi:hypothetical protein
MKYIVKLKDGRELEAARKVSDALCPLGFSLIKKDNPDSNLYIQMVEGGEVKTTFDNVKSIEIIFDPKL